MPDFKDQVAIVHGGSGELGTAIAMRLAKEGARVAFTYRSDKEEADGLIEAIEAISATALGEAVDIVDFAAISEFTQKMVSKWGRLDVLVNVVGARDEASLFDMTPEQFNHVLDVNLRGYFNCIRAAAPILRDQGNGRIVNVVSAETLRGKGTLNEIVAKSGVIGLTRAAAREFGPHGVTVNAVAPGLVETGSMKDIPAEIVDKAINSSVLGKLARPGDVAEAVLFLASNRARHMTGEVLRVDGGRHLGAAQPRPKLS